MTVRELIQKLLSEAPDLDANVSIDSEVDDVESRSHEILNIFEESNDYVIIQITK